MVPQMQPYCVTGWQPGHHDQARHGKEDSAGGRMTEYARTKSRPHTGREMNLEGSSRQRAKSRSFLRIFETELRFCEYGCAPKTLGARICSNLDMLNGVRLVIPAIMHGCLLSLLTRAMGHARGQDTDGRLSFLLAGTREAVENGGGYPHGAVWLALGAPQN